jgi:hypothetical protein
MKRAVLHVSALSLCSTLAVAEIPNLAGSTRCTRSPSVVACSDNRGSYYSVSRAKDTVTAGGFDASSRQRWSQTMTRFGSVYFFSGITSEGQIWVGTSRKIGWDMRMKMSTSKGDQSRFVCNRLVGCQ